MLVILVIPKMLVFLRFLHGLSLVFVVYVKAGLIILNCVLVFAKKKLLLILIWKLMVLISSNMCTHQRFINPPHSRHPLYVKCGKCPACLQEKASLRVSRIKNSLPEGYICLMVALTYSRNTAPYVDREMAYDFVNGRLSELPIFRDCSVRKVRKPSDFNDYNQVYKFNYQRVVLDSIEFEHESSLLNTKDLKYEFNKIGVCYYKDYQHFIARLRLNLKRHYNYEGKFFVYACSELGVKSHRPHFHLLIFCEMSIEASMRNAIFESWPFSNLRRFPRAVERAYKAASYVASYVNKPSNFPCFFKHYFKEKHSYSKGFGLCNQNFSLSKILSKVESGFIKYSVLTNKSGYPVIKDVPIPSYVINRYFPKFKGYTTCAPSSLLSYMLRIVRYDWDILYPLNNEPLCNRFVYGISDGSNYLSDDEVRKVCVRLRNAYKRYCKYAPDGYPLTIEDYLRLHIKVWNCYNSSILRLHLTNPDIPWFEKYDNLDVVLKTFRPINGKFGFECLREYDKIKETNPNKFTSVCFNTKRFEESFHDTIKHRKVANGIYNESADCEL